MKLKNKKYYRIRWLTLGSIKWPLLLRALLVISLLFISSFLFFMMQEQRYIGIKINLAGRQRMLSQKIFKEILLTKYTQFPSVDLEMSIAVFDRTLYALAEGGEVPTDLNFSRFRILPQEKHKKTINQLSKVDRLWNEFKGDIDPFLKESDEVSLELISKNNIILLNEIDKTVLLLQNSFERRANIIIMGSLTVVIITLSVLVFMLLQKVKQFNQASEQIQALEKFLPICSKCKRIRIDDSNPMDMQSWTPIESFISGKIDTNLTHGLCPECSHSLYPEFFQKS